MAVDGRSTLKMSTSGKEDLDTARRHAMIDVVVVIFDLQCMIETAAPSSSPMHATHVILPYACCTAVLRR